MKLLFIIPIWLLGLAATLPSAPGASDGKRSDCAKIFSKFLEVSHFVMILIKSISNDLPCSIVADVTDLTASSRP
jgi:hypothetical protein